MRQQSDEQLIRETLEGSQAAFAEIVRRHERRVAATIRSVVGEVSREDLADIAQDVFLLVFRGLSSFRGDAQFSTWLTRIALRHCYREAKRRRRRTGLFSRFAVRADDRDPPEERLRGTDRTDSGLIAGEMGARLEEAIQSLPEEYRTVLVLRTVEEMSVDDVAEVLGISAGTVKSRLHRARERLRERLADPALEFEPGFAD